MLNYKYNLRELLNILEETNELDEFIADIFRFNLICDENYGIHEILFDPHVKPESKLKYMVRVLQPELRKYFYNFLTQLVINNDIPYYEYISKKFVNLLAKEKNCHYIEVISAVPLISAQLENIKIPLKKSEGKEVFLYNSISAKVLGGFVINRGDKMIDLSIQGALEKFRAGIIHS